MENLKVLSAAEQVAGYLKNGMAAGVWRGEMPGAVALTADLGVNHKTVEAALRLLVREGVLADQGARKPRLIQDAARDLRAPSLRIGFLLADEFDRQVSYLVEMRHRLLESGHAPFIAKQNLDDLGMEADRVAAFVDRTPADAWVVVGASRGVAEWFVAGSRPFFALFGLIRQIQYAGAGPDKSTAYADVARALVAHGHRRIVLLAKPQRRHPVPGHAERTFLRTLAEAGIQVADYHFPHWENSKSGFHRCLESLFRVSPPTALLVQEPTLFGAVQQFFAERGIRVPHDVSLVCDDPDPTFAWRVPSVAHIRWDPAPCIRRIIRWADRIARGEHDIRRVLSRAELVAGGTLGPVRKIR